MEDLAYHIEAQAEPYHWWYVGRKRLVVKEIQKQGIQAHHAILDVGTCMGTNLIALANHGYHNAIGIDNSELALSYCRQRGLDNAIFADATNLPYSDEHFHCILATDILEHLADEQLVLQQIKRVLKPNGTLVITVPAFNALWGPGDDASHHYRRYRIKPLIQLIEQAGFHIQHHYYFNYLLFLPIFIVRKLLNRLPQKIESEFQLGNPLLNRLLTALFKFDIFSSRKVKMPFGVSILLVAQKVTS